MKYQTSPPPSRPTSPASTTSLPSPTPNRLAAPTASEKRYKYLRRLFKFRQMDFEFAIWQMLYLFISPQKVYRNFQYRKQTKDQFARDDPAFLVLLSFWILVSSLALTIVLGLHFSGFLKFILWMVFVDCIGVGIVTASVMWLICNHYLKKPTCVDQDVEWGYAFDVHLNAFFPFLIILHVVQVFFYHVLIGNDWWISRLFGNTLWFIALAYYIYITFLGYSCLPILRNTQVLLYPMMLLLLSYFVSLFIGMNIVRDVMVFYRNRVV